MRLTATLTAAPPAVTVSTPRQPIDEPATAPATYLDLYGLAKPPFGPTAEPAPFQSFPSQRAIFNTLVSGLRSGRGHLLLVGEAGVGKSTLLATAWGLVADRHQQIFRISRVKPGPLTRLRVVAQLLDIAEPDELTPEHLTKARAILASGPTASLVIDDAQYLTPDALDWLVRIITRRNDDPPQLILVGRPNLETMLRQKPCKPLTDRLAEPLRIERLTASEMQQYVERRLWLAGSSIRRLMTRAALRKMIRQADGCPGRIDTLMDNALAAGFLHSEPQLTPRAIRAAERRLPASERFADRGKLATIAAVVILILGIVAFGYRAWTGSAADTMPSAQSHSTH